MASTGKVNSGVGRREGEDFHVRLEGVASNRGAGSAGGGWTGVLRPGPDSALPPLLLCVAALTVLRLAGVWLGSTDLFFDEAQYWFWSRELASGYYSKPPLIAWIIRASTEVCGMGEACIRTPSALIHGATALVIYGIGRKLYDARTGFWAGLLYATLPGVSLSSTLISTDVPLLFFVALALLAVVQLRERVTWDWVAVLGVSLGLGFLSKYAMSYFLLGVAVYALVAEEGRALLKSPRIYAAFALAAAMIAPNILWNLQNKFATLGHTADNAAWGGGVRPIAALEFVGEQFAVFGPVMFAALMWYCLRLLGVGRAREAAGRPERLLLAFSVPVLLLMTGQAFLSRAHANWAAFAYIAGTVLVTAVLLRDGRMRLVRFSLGLHLVVAALIALGGVLAGRVTLPVAGHAYSRVLGWKALAEATGEKARTGGFRAIAADRRNLSAELNYYLRDVGLPIVALTEGRRPHDHFEMARPVRPDTPRPILLVSFSASVPEGADAAGSAEIAAGKRRRKVYFYAIRDILESNE